MLINVAGAMSVSEAVRYTGLSRSTLYRLMKDGTLESVKIRRRRLIRRDALNALIGRAPRA